MPTTRSFAPRRRRFVLWNHNNPFLDDAVLFVLGAAGGYSINVIGALPGGEALMLLLLPFLLLSHGRRAFDRQYLWFYVLTFGWLLGTLISDQYNGIGWLNQAKGIARVVFFILDFVGLAILTRNQPRKFIVLSFGMATVMLLSAAHFDDLMTAFKFGASSALIILSLLVSSCFYAKKRYRVCAGIGAALALLNLGFAFRSQVVIVLVSSVLILPLDIGRNAKVGSSRGGERSTLSVVVLLAIAGVCALLANEGIKYAANLGLYEESTQQKFQTQSGGRLGVLFGGRPETLVAMQAIIDRPILGHGSFAADIRYVEMEQELQYEYGYSDTDIADDVEYPAIPTHSHLTMAWVESGILGGILWIYIFAIATRALLRTARTLPGLAPLYSYFLVNFLWDILYSPFGSVNRMLGAYFILMSYHLLKAPEQGARYAGLRQPRLVNLRRVVHPRVPVSGLLNDFRH